MIAFDTDVLSEVFFDKPYYVGRAEAIPKQELAISIVVYEELIGGRLALIEKIETQKSKTSIGGGVCSAASHSRISETISVDSIHE